MIDQAFLRRYATRWRNNFERAATSSLNLIAIIATIVSALGITLGGFKFAWFVFGGLLCYLLFVAWTVRPPYLNPAHFVSRVIEPGQLDDFPVYIPRIGLIGKEDVGKTTFFDSSVSREYKKQQTSKPVAQIVVVPDSTGPEYIALIDTVGQRDQIQYEIQKMSDVLIVFLDHNASATDQMVDESRIITQKYFMDQVIKANKSSNSKKGVVILLNKADIWDGESDRGMRLERFIVDIEADFSNEKTYSVARRTANFSNNRPGQGAAVLRLAYETYRALAHA